MQNEQSSSAVEKAHKMNLQQLQRHDNSAVEIVDTSPHVAVYVYVDSKWIKSGVEGSLIVYKRNATPPYIFCVLNRNSPANLIEEISVDLEVQNDNQYMFYRRLNESKSKINGLWFYKPEDLYRISFAVKKLCSDTDGVLDTAHVTREAQRFSAVHAPAQEPTKVPASLQQRQPMQPAAAGQSSGENVLSMLFQSRPARSQADMTNSDDNQIKGFMMAGELEQNMLERTQQMALNSGRDSAAARRTADVANNARAAASKKQHEAQRKTQQPTPSLTVLNGSAPPHAFHHVSPAKMQQPTAPLVVHSIDEFRQLPPETQEKFFRHLQQKQQSQSTVQQWAQEQQQQQHQVDVTAPPPVVRPMPVHFSIASSPTSAQRMNDVPPVNAQYTAYGGAPMFGAISMAQRNDALLATPSSTNMLRNYSMLAQAGSPDPISTTVPSKNSSVASGLTPLTKEQLAQALQYMLTVCSYIGGNIHTVQNDTTFITQLHEAYVKSLNERFAALPQRARRPSDD